MAEENDSGTSESSPVLDSEVPPPPTSSEVPPPPPGSGVVSQQPTSGLPTWLTSDWLVVIVASIGVFLSAIVAGAILGAINALVFTSSASAAINGAITGLYLGFSSFAVETSAVNIESEFSAVVATKYLPIAWCLGFIAIVWYGYRFCEQRIDLSVENRRALTLKLALVFGLVTAIAGALLSFNQDSIESNLFGFGDDGLSAKVNSGTAFLYGILFVTVIGVFFHGRSKQPIITFTSKTKQNVFFQNFSSDVIEGAKMYLITLGGMGLGGSSGSYLYSRNDARSNSIDCRFPALSRQSRYCGSYGGHGWFGRSTWGNG